MTSSVNFEENHAGECRFLKKLRDYWKPRSIHEICEVLHRNEDPKNIPRLQALRKKLGSDYQDSVKLLSAPTVKGETEKSPNCNNI
mmetsp:Transcript_50315/g.56136  ORF Transcript_50315/g.56136 Transcript_50315/m.56136 type:complete len:86 (-) Transcript_50315:353-610(-)